MNKFYIKDKVEQSLEIIRFRWHKSIVTNNILCCSSAHASTLSKEKGVWSILLSGIPDTCYYASVHVVKSSRRSIAGKTTLDCRYVLRESSVSVKITMDVLAKEIIAAAYKTFEVVLARNTTWDVCDLSAKQFSYNLKLKFASRYICKQKAFAVTQVKVRLYLFKVA